MTNLEPMTITALCERLLKLEASLQSTKYDLMRISTANWHSEQMALVAEAALSKLEKDLAP